MKIPLPADNFIYFGKQNKEIQLIKKSADLVKDEHGAVTGSAPTYSLENIEKYVDIVFLQILFSKILFLCLRILLKFSFQ